MCGGDVVARLTRAISAVRGDAGLLAHFFFARQ